MHARRSPRRPRRAPAAPTVALLASAAITAPLRANTATWYGTDANTNWDAALVLSPLTFYTNWRAPGAGGGIATFLPNQDTDVTFGAEFSSGNPKTNGQRTVKSLTVDSVKEWAITGERIALVSGALTRTATSVGNQSIDTTSLSLTSGFAAPSVFSIGGAGSLTIRSSITGGNSLGLTKSGPGTLVFAGSTQNAYGGPTLVAAGTLRLAKSNATFAITGPVEIAPGATLALDAAEQLAFRPITVNGTLQLNGNAVTVSDLSGDATGSIQLGGGTFNLFPQNNLSYFGTLSGPGTFQMTGNSLYLLGTQPNTNADLTLVNAGTLNLGKSPHVNALGSASITVGPAAEIFQFQEDQLPDTSSLTLDGILTLSGTGTETIRTLTGAGRARLLNTSLHINPVGASSFSGTIEGSGATFRKSGSDNYTLSGASANTFTGLTQVSAGTLTLAKTGNKASVAGNLTIDGGNVVFATDYQTAPTTQITLSAGTLAIGSTTQFAAALSLSPGTTADVGRGTLFVDHPGPTPPAALLASLRSAYNHGRWNQPGITSSVAANDPNRATAVGYSDDGNVLTLRYTWLGDFNLDGLVNAADRSILNTALASPAGPHAWQTGDLNYDGKLTNDDLALFALGAAISAGRNIASIPEPTFPFACVYATLTALPRRRRHHIRGHRPARRQ